MPPNQAINKLPPSEKISASVSKEAFRSMFYLLSGKPDSKVKLFHRKITVTPEDIKFLNKQVNEKLRLHSIDQIITTATVKFDKKEIVEFGVWSEFEEFEWRIPTITQEITLKWDFMLKLQEYAAPQRHTMVVRLSTAPRPQDIFQMLITQGPDAEDLETKLALCLVRIDFLSHRLADELIDVVKKWNESLRQPIIAHNWFAKLEPWSNWIGRIIHYSLPVMFVLASIIVINLFFQDKAENTPNIGDFINISSWLLVSVIGVYISTNFSKLLATRSCSSIHEYGVFRPFQMTRGDENEAVKIDRANGKKITKFCISTGVSVILNILSGLFIYYFFPSS